MPGLHPDLPETDFRALGRQVIDLLAEYYATIEDEPAFPACEPGAVAALFDAPVPEAAEPVAALLADWREKIIPNSSRQGSPRWFGFVNGSGTQIGALADAMASALNPNCGGWRASPAATEIERRTIRWLAELIGYAPDCGGVFVSGGTMANAAALRTALHAKATWDLSTEGLQQRGGAGRMAIYLADHETHVSLLRAVDLLGLGRAALRQVPSHDDFTMDVTALERMIDDDVAAAMRPFCILGNVGSINVGAIDDIDALADVAARRGLWLHVDGACGALGGILPELRPQLAAMARADSVSFDAHKWLGVPYEAGCLLVRDPETLRAAYTMHATYLLPAEENEYDGLNYFEYGPQLSRSWRAFKVWMTLRYYGAAGIRTFFRQTIACATRLHELVAASADFEVVQPAPLLYIYSFRWAPEALRGDDELLDQLNQKISDELQRRKIAFAMTTRIHGRVTQRLSICSHRTTLADIDATVEAMRAIGAELLTAHGA
ncbi:MAG: pyridoxal phosphate-dependent decarboxylase family protein [Gemmatimonadales bacterium]